MRRKTLALIAVVAMLVLAGCTGGGTTTSATSTETTDSVPSAEQLQQRAITTMGNVSEYHAQQNATIVQRSNNLNQTTTLGVAYAVDRPDRRLVSHRTVSRANQQTVVDRYIVNQTLYQRSDQYTARYGSEWIKQDYSSNFTSRFHLSDQLWRYQFILGNASLSDVSTATVNGTAAYVVTADVDMAEFNQALNDRLPGRDSEAPNMTVEATFWIDTETYRPIKVQRSVEGSQTIRGQTIEFTRDLETTLRYEPVSIALPDGAEDAVTVGQ